MGAGGKWPPLGQKPSNYHAHVEKFHTDMHYMLNHTAPKSGKGKGDAIPRAVLEQVVSSWDAIYEKHHKAPDVRDVVAKIDRIDLRTGDIHTSMNASDPTLPPVKTWSQHIMATSPSRLPNNTVPCFSPVATS